MKKTFIYLSAVVAGVFSLNAANAATATGTLTVRATVTNSCVLNTSATGTTTNAVLDFGTLSSLAGNVDLIVTTGGTGVSPHDVTPEATAPLIKKLLPGIPEAFRAYSRDRVPTTDLSRGLAGVTGSSLINNLSCSKRLIVFNIRSII